MVNSFGFVFAKLLYDRNPKPEPNPYNQSNVSAEMMLVLRSTWATIIMIFLINLKAKKILYDDIGKGDVFPLAFRSVQGTIVNLINFAATKVVPLAIIGVLNNLSPVCCVILAYFMLGEKLKRSEMIVLGLIFLCIVDIVVTGKPDPNSLHPTKTITEAPLIYLALICCPFLTAAGTIALKKI